MAASEYADGWDWGPGAGLLAEPAVLLDGAPEDTLLSSADPRTPLLEDGGTAAVGR